MGKLSKVRGQISKRANEPEGEKAWGQNGKGAKKPDTSKKWTI